MQSNSTKQSVGAASGHREHRAEHWAENWTLDPTVHFLNHGSFGAVLAEVQELQQDFRDRLERQPVDFILRQLPPLFDAARETVAAYLNADPAGLVFVSNATDGVNAVLRSLPIGAGDELLYTNHGYNACNNVMDYVADRAGAVARPIPIPFPIASEDDVVRAVEAQLTDKTTLVLVDHVTSPTGLVFPVKRIVDMLRSRGIASLVDGAHSPGMLAVDLTDLDADYFVANGHKWLCAPKSVGILYVRGAHREQVLPTVISHGANTPRADHTVLQDQFDWPGTIDATPALCLAESIRRLGKLVEGGWPAIYERNRELALYGRGLLCEVLGIDAPSPESMIGTLAAVPLPPAPAGHVPGAFTPDPLHVALWEKHRIEVPVFHYPGEPARLLRISAHLHNRRENYSALADALRTELCA